MLGGQELVDRQTGSKGYLFVLGKFRTRIAKRSGQNLSEVLDLSRSSLTALIFADPDFGENPICSLFLGLVAVNPRVYTGRRPEKTTLVASGVDLHSVLFTGFRHRGQMQPPQAQRHHENIQHRCVYIYIYINIIT